MIFEVHWIDVTMNLASQQQPVFLLERPLAHGTQPKGGVFNVAEVAREGTFWCPTSDLNHYQVQWSKTSKDQYVRIPVFAYKTEKPFESVLMGMAIQLGMQAMESLRHQTAAEIVKTVLVLGHQVHHLQGGGYRGYVGVAFHTKE